MPEYGFAVTEDSLELITFLNDGIRPPIEKKRTFLICEFPGPREIKSKIVYEEELHGTTVHVLLED